MEYGAENGKVTDGQVTGLEAAMLPPSPGLEATLREQGKPDASDVAIEPLLKKQLVDYGIDVI